MHPLRRAAVACGLVLVAPAAHAAKHPRFEPTDLELDEPGVLDVDLQLGPVKGPHPWRLVVPDFEVDLGLFSNVELDLDGAYAIEGVDVGTPGPTLFDHQAPDNLWASVKIGLGDWRDPTTRRAWAVGIQLGPKLPVATATSGIGFEGLALVGRTDGPVHVVLDVGGLVDPRIGGTARPAGLEAGIDLDIDLTARDTWSLLGELGGIYYTSADANQLAATAGIQWSPSERLDLSLVALLGFASGSDPYGVMFGVSPKLALW